ncbi:MAG: hypothetical protein HY742_01620 [Deltaproteobacteria bacterium]|nr:hypothetical protein [Deltaproteobacteria bacterium]
MSSLRPRFLALAALLLKIYAICPARVILYPHPPDLIELRSKHVKVVLFILQCGFEKFPGTVIVSRKTS